MIRADLDLLADRLQTFRSASLRRSRQRAQPRRATAKTPERQAFPPPAPIPAWARASGRAGEGDPLFAAGAGLALLDACLRADPPAAGALRARLALQSAAASAKILRLNADEAALRDLRFAVGDPLGPAANLCRCGATAPAGRPASTQAGFVDAAARLDLAVGPERPRSEPEGLRRGGRSGFGGRKGRRPGVLRPPGRPSRPKPKFWRFGCSTSSSPFGCAGRGPAADRCENPGSDPAVAGRGRRPRPGDPAWPNAAAGAIALAAASALDLAADLSRRSNTLIAVAPKLRSKPAQKIVDLLLAQDCVSPAEAARHAPMTGRAARRLFDRLVLLGAARELSGRPAFRLYGL